MTARFLAVTVMLAILGGLANAQELATDLSQLRVLVKPGDSLTVTDIAGQRSQGKLVQLDGSGLALELPDKQRRQFAGPTINIVEKRGGDSLKNGALIGLISGGVLGAVAGASAADYEDCCAGAYVGGLAAFYGGLGAAIGVGIDALIKGQRVIYAKSQPTVTIAPVLDRQRQGLVLTFRR